MSLGGTRQIHVTIPGGEEEPKRQQSPSLYRRWNRFSSLQRLLLSVVAFALILIIFFLVPTIRNDLLRLKEEENSINMPSEREMGETVEMGAEEAGIVGTDGQLVRFRKGPPPIKERPFHFVTANQGVGGGHDGESKDFTQSNKSLQFSGPTNSRQTAVISAFKHAWSAYRRYAWGKDELKPISKSHSDWFNCGLTLLDALDTMYIMGLKDEFDEAKEWVRNNNLVSGKDVNLFEFTIRVVGGLLGAYHLSNEEMFLSKAVDLGDKLMPAFKSPSGIPFSDVNLRTGKAHGPHWSSDSSLSEVTTIQLEFNDLSFCTKEEKFRDAAYLVSTKVHNLPKQHKALVPMYINPRGGSFRSGGMLTLGARVDSYYEYLLKQWLQTGKKDDMLKQDYLEAVDAIEKVLVRESEPHKLTFVGEVDVVTSKFYAKMDHLVCFLPGTLALGHAHGLPESHLLLARKLMFTCYQTYFTTATGLAPEISHFNTLPGIKDDIYIKPADSHNLLRPETVESLFYMFSITREPQYQEWGWKIFNAFENYTKLTEGYTSINNVKNPRNVEHRNKMESFFLGETLKYFYLLFQNPADNEGRIWPELDKWVFNTEAHLLPIRDGMKVSR